MIIRIILFLTFSTTLHSQELENNKYWIKTRDKKEYKSSLKQTNWFKEKTDSIKEQTLKSINDLDNDYLCLALDDISFDAEGFWNYNDYKKLTEKLFQLLNIPIEISGSGKNKDDLIKLNIKIDNVYKNFVFDKRENGDWIDDEYLNEINSIIKVYSKKKIFTLPVVDQVINCIIISSSEYSDFLGKGLIPKEPDYLIRIEYENSKN